MPISDQVIELETKKTGRNILFIVLISVLAAASIVFAVLWATKAPAVDPPEVDSIEIGYTDLAQVNTGSDSAVKQYYASPGCTYTVYIDLMLKDGTLEDDISSALDIKSSPENMIEPKQGSMLNPENKLQYIYVFSVSKSATTDFNIIITSKYTSSVQTVMAMKLENSETAAYFDVKENENGVKTLENYVNGDFSDTPTEYALKRIDDKSTDTSVYYKLNADYLPFYESTGQNIKNTFYILNFNQLGRRDDYGKYVKIKTDVDMGDGNYFDQVTVDAGVLPSDGSALEDSDYTRITENSANSALARFYPSSLRLSRGELYCRSCIAFQPRAAGTMLIKLTANRFNGGTLREIYIEITFKSSNDMENITEILFYNPYTGLESDEMDLFVDDFSDTKPFCFDKFVKVRHGNGDPQPAVFGNGDISYFISDANGKRVTDPSKTPLIADDLDKIGEVNVAPRFGTVAGAVGYIRFRDTDPTGFNASKIVKINVVESVKKFTVDKLTSTTGNYKYPSHSGDEFTLNAVYGFKAKTNAEKFLETDVPAVNPRITLNYPSDKPGFVAPVLDITGKVTAASAKKSIVVSGITSAKGGAYVIEPELKKNASDAASLLTSLKFTVGEDVPTGDYELTFTLDSQGLSYDKENEGEMLHAERLSFTVKIEITKLAAGIKIKQNAFTGNDSNDRWEERTENVGGTPVKKAYLTLAVNTGTSIYGSDNYSTSFMLRDLITFLDDEENEIDYIADLSNDVNCVWFAGTDSQDNPNIYGKDVSADLVLTEVNMGGLFIKPRITSDSDILPDTHVLVLHLQNNKEFEINIEYRKAVKNMIFNSDAVGGEAKLVNGILTYTDNIAYNPPVSADGSTLSDNGIKDKFTVYAMGTNTQGTTVTIKNTDEVIDPDAFGLDIAVLRKPTAWILLPKLAISSGTGTTPTVYYFMPGVDVSKITSENFNTYREYAVFYTGYENILYGYNITILKDLFALNVLFDEMNTSGASGADSNGITVNYWSGIDFQHVRYYYSYDFNKNVQTADADDLIKTNDRKVVTGASSNYVLITERSYARTLNDFAVYTDDNYDHIMANDKDGVSGVHSTDSELNKYPDGSDIEIYASGILALAESTLKIPGTSDYAGSRYRVDTQGGGHEYRFIAARDNQAYGFEICGYEETPCTTKNSTTDKLYISGSNGSYVAYCSEAEKNKEGLYIDYKATTPSGDVKWRVNITTTNTVTPIDSITLWYYNESSVKTNIDSTTIPFILYKNGTPDEKKIVIHYTVVYKPYDSSSHTALEGFEPIGSVYDGGFTAENSGTLPSFKTVPGSLALSGGLTKSGDIFTYEGAVTVTVTNADNAEGYTFTLKRNGTATTAIECALIRVTTLFESLTITQTGSASDIAGSTVDYTYSLSASNTYTLELNFNSGIDMKNISVAASGLSGTLDKDDYGKYTYTFTVENEHTNETVTFDITQKVEKDEGVYDKDNSSSPYHYYVNVRVAPSIASFSFALGDKTVSSTPTASGSDYYTFVTTGQSGDQEVTARVTVNDGTVASTPLNFKSAISIQLSSTGTFFYQETAATADHVDYTVKVSNSVSYATDVTLTCTINGMSASFVLKIESTDNVIQSYNTAFASTNAITVTNNDPVNLAAKVMNAGAASGRTELITYGYKLVYEVTAISGGITLKGPDGNGIAVNGTAEYESVDYNVNFTPVGTEGSFTVKVYYGKEGGVQTDSYAEETYTVNVKLAVTGIEIKKASGLVNGTDIKMIAGQQCSDGAGGTQSDIVTLTAEAISQYSSLKPYYTKLAYEVTGNTGVVTVGLTNNDVNKNAEITVEANADVSGTATVTLYVLDSSDARVKDSLGNDIKAYFTVTVYNPSVELTVPSAPVDIFGTGAFGVSYEIKDNNNITDSVTVTFNNGVNIAQKDTQAAIYWSDNNGSIAVYINKDKITAEDVGKTYTVTVTAVICGVTRTVTDTFKLTTSNFTVQLTYDGSTVGELDKNSIGGHVFAISGIPSGYEHAVTINYTVEDNAFTVSGDTVSAFDHTDKHSIKVTATVTLLGEDYNTNIVTVTLVDSSTLGAGLYHSVFSGSNDNLSGLVNNVGSFASYTKFDDDDFDDDFEIDFTGNACKIITVLVDYSNLPSSVKESGINASDFTVSGIGALEPLQSGLVHKADSQYYYYVAQYKAISSTTIHPMIRLRAAGVTYSVDLPILHLTSTAPLFEISADTVTLAAGDNTTITISNANSAKFKGSIDYAFEASTPAVTVTNNNDGTFSIHANVTEAGFNGTFKFGLEVKSGVYKGLQQEFSVYASVGGIIKPQFSVSDMWLSDYTKTFTLGDMITVTDYDNNDTLFTANGESFAYKVEFFTTGTNTVHNLLPDRFSKTEGNIVQNSLFTDNISEHANGWFYEAKLKITVTDGYYKDTVVVVDPVKIIIAPAVESFTCANNNANVSAGCDISISNNVRMPSSSSATLVLREYVVSPAEAGTVTSSDNGDTATFNAAADYTGAVSITVKIKINYRNTDNYCTPKTINLTVVKSALTTSGITVRAGEEHSYSTSDFSSDITGKAITSVSITNTRPDILTITSSAISVAVNANTSSNNSNVTVVLPVTATYANGATRSGELTLTITPLTAPVLTVGEFNTSTYKLTITAASGGTPAVEIIAGDNIATGSLSGNVYTLTPDTYEGTVTVKVSMTVTDSKYEGTAYYNKTYVETRSVFVNVKNKPTIECTAQNGVITAKLSNSNAKVTFGHINTNSNVIVTGGANGTFTYVFTGKREDISGRSFNIAITATLDDYSSIAVDNKSVTLTVPAVPTVSAAIDQSNKTVTPSVSSFTGTVAYEYSTSDEYSNYVNFTVTATGANYSVANGVSGTIPIIVNATITGGQFSAVTLTCRNNITVSSASSVTPAVTTTNYVNGKITLTLTNVSTYYYTPYYYFSVLSGSQYITLTTDSTNRSNEATYTLKGNYQNQVIRVKVYVKLNRQNTTYYTLYYNGSEANSYVTIPVPTQYTVTFDSQGGSSVSSQEVKSGEKAIAPATPTRTGYTFGGWYTNSGCTSAYDFATPVTANKTLYAKWTANDYNVTYVNVYGATNPNASTYKYGVGIASLSSLTGRTGYTFDAWYSDPDCSSAHKVTSISTTQTGDVVLYAGWNVSTYTVTFNSHGGSSVASANDIAYNSTVPEPAAPTFTGHTFAGWYKENTYNNKFNFGSDKITANTELHAKWTVNKYTVTFNTQGGTAVSSQSIDYNGNATKPTDPTRTDYTFGGWYTVPACTGTEYDFANTAVTADITLYAKWNEKTFYYAIFVSDGAVVKTESRVLSGTAVTPPTLSKTNHTLSWYTSSDYSGSAVTSFTVSANVTYYAKWTPAEYDITYNVMSGATHSNPAKYTYGSSFTLADAELNGYTFGGWYTDSGYTPAKKVTAVNATDSGNITLYGKLTKITYTVAFNSQGGSSVSNFTVSIDNSYKATEPTVPTLDNYDFGGWYTDSACNYKFNFTNTVISSDITLYAKWTAKSYSITYNLDDGVNSPANTSSYVYGVGLTLQDPTKEGYTFGGWYTDSTKTYNQITVISATSTGPVTVYAKWNKITYTVIFDSQGGSSVSNATVSIDNSYKATEPTAPTLDNYDFGGWYTDSACNYKFDFANTVISSDIRLYAKWTAKSYSITYNLRAGATHSNPATYAYGSSFTLADAELNGYTFGGWYTDSGYTPAKKVTAVNATDSGSITLYGKLEAKTYNVLFIVDGSVVQTRSIAYDTVIDNDYYTPDARADYNFNGWYTSSACSGEVITSYTVKGDGALYGAFTPKSYSITYVLDGGEEGGEYPESYVYGVGLDLSTLTEPTKDGKGFGGWYTDGSFDDEYVITAISNTASGNITLYAKWND